jgi:hypothetical protein
MRAESSKSISEHAGSSYKICRPVLTYEYERLRLGHLRNKSSGAKESRPTQQFIPGIAYFWFLGLGLDFYGSYKT